MNKDEVDKLAMRIAYLLHAYIMQTISEAEHNELDEWVCASIKNQRLFEELTDPGFLEKSKKSIQMINEFLNPN
jgi:transmembrane sensor